MLVLLTNTLVHKYNIINAVLICFLQNVNKFSLFYFSILKIKTDENFLSQKSNLLRKKSKEKCIFLSVNRIINLLYLQFFTKKYSLHFILNLLHNIVFRIF